MLALWGSGVPLGLWSPCVSLRSELQVGGLHAHCCVGGGACRRDMASDGWFHLSLTPREKRTQGPLCPSGDLRRPSPPGGIQSAPPGGRPLTEGRVWLPDAPSQPAPDSASLYSHRPQFGWKELVHSFSFSRNPSPTDQQAVQTEPLSSSPSSHCFWVATHSTLGQNPSGIWSLLPAASLLLSWALA